MNRDNDEGVILTVQKTDAQNGVLHADPCECHEIIQVGAEHKGVLRAVETMLGDLASQHNAIVIGCSDCGFEGFLGPGDKAADDGNKAVIDESDCPECGGDLISLERDTCDHETSAIDSFYDESDLTDDTNL